MRDALKDTLVVSLEQAVAAPFASRKLAAAGARVIKIERGEGDFARNYDEAVLGQSSYFVWLNRGKESLVLDIKDAADAALLHQIIERADVFIQNLAPGAAERAGFGSEELRRSHPRLVTCEISGYGESGPYANMKAYDTLVQGESGLIAVTGHPGAPARIGVSLCDIGAGMHAFSAILQALIARERSGVGCSIRISLFDCMADWMAVPYLHYSYGGRAPGPGGMHHPSIAPYGSYAAQDGRLVIIAIQNEREWHSFCEAVLGRPDVAYMEAFDTNTRRVAHRPALNAIIDEVFSRTPLDTLTELLQGAGIAFGRVNSVEDFARHPQLRLADAGTPAGEIRLPADPVRIADEHETQSPRVPVIGEHSDAIRREFAGRE